jgi:hypothetical protein
MSPTSYQTAPSRGTIEARESIAKKDKAEVVPAKPKGKPGRKKKGEVRPAPEPSPLERQRGQTLEQMLFELDTACATGTKKNAQGYKISWKGYKLHLDTACCGVPISAVLTGANVHDSRVALPLTRISAQRVDVCYELMDAAYCSAVIREDIQAAGRVSLIDHNPRKGEKKEFAPHEAQRYTVHQFNQCHGRVVTNAETHFQNTGVATWTGLETGTQVIEQLGDAVTVTQAVKCQDGGWPQ